MDIELKYIRKIFEGLPENLQHFIISEATAKKVYETGKKNNLSDIQIIDLSMLIGDVLLGLEPVEKFLTNLKEKLKLDNEKIITIASEINQTIFFPFKETLRNVYQSTQKQIEPLLKKEEKSQIPEKETIEKITETLTKGAIKEIRVPKETQSKPIGKQFEQKFEQKEEIQKKPQLSTPTPPRPTPPPIRSPIPPSSQNKDKISKPRLPTEKRTELKTGMLEELTK